MRSWLVGSAVALLGCSAGSDGETVLRATTDRATTDQPGVAPAEAGDSAAPSSTDVSSTDVSVADVSVDGELPAAVNSPLDACPAYAEFEPLGAIPEQYGVSWKVIDPRAGYVYWTHEWSGNDVRFDHYRWTATAGIERLDELLQPSANAGVTQLYLDYVSRDGRVLVGGRLSEEHRVQGAFRYAPETGMAVLEFYPRALSRDGKVAIEVRDGRPLRWTETGGSMELAVPSQMLAWNFGSARFWLSEMGDTILGAGVLEGAEPHVVRWTVASGWVNLGSLPAGVAQPDTIAVTVSEAGNAIVGTRGNPAAGGSRVFRWTEASGSTELGALAGLPPEASYLLTHLSADGSVVVGSVQIPGQPASRIFRWTQALGMQDLMPGAGSVYPSQMSARGDVVIARDSDGVVETNSHRWTATGGVEKLALHVQAASSDGNLLVGARGAKPAIQAFGPGGSAPPTLAELALPTVVPPDWSGALIENVSADGHLVVGIAQNPRGEREAWLLRRTERCPAR